MYIVQSKSTYNNCMLIGVALTNYIHVCNLKLNYVTCGEPLFLEVNSSRAHTLHAVVIVHTTVHDIGMKSNS